MDKLILDLLDYGHISHMSLHFESVSLQKAVARTLRDLHAAIESSHAVVQVDALPDDVRADFQLLQRVLASIIANALQFPKPNEPPRIRIWSEERGGTVRLWVRDEGIGIPPEYQEKVFGPFQTLAAPHPEHTGIGLAIVRKCIERMRGRVGVESKPGSGAAFWIELPLHVTHRSVQHHPEGLDKESPLATTS
jgi:signal transduction histidine kinase